MSRADRNPDDAVETQDVADGPTQGKSAAGDWFLEHAGRGQLLLEQGHLARAREVFEAMLARLGPEPSYRQAVTLERLGRCHLMSGAIREGGNCFHRALAVTEKLAPTSGVQALQGILDSSLGDALAAIGELDKARKAYEAAVDVAEALGDRRAQGVDLDHLGTVAQRQGRLDDARRHHEAALQLFQAIGEEIAQATATQNLASVCAVAGQWEEAEAHYREAARLRESCGDWPGAAQAWSSAAGASEKAGHSEATEACHRKAIEDAGRSRDPIVVRRHLLGLARLLKSRPGRLGEAREIAEAALDTLTLETYAPDIWTMYGEIADIVERQAESGAGEALARNFRHVQQYGPRLHETLVGLAEDASYARAVVMGRLGRCFLMGARPQLAVAFLGSASELCEKLAAGELVAALQGMLSSELGDALRAAGRPEQARGPYERALEAAEQARDLRAQGLILDRLGAVAIAEGRSEEGERHLSAAARLKAAGEDAAGEHVPMPEEGDESALPGEPHITIYDDISTDCVFATDLLVDVGHAFQIAAASATPDLLSDAIRPMLRPGTRTYVDENGTPRFCLPPSEPALERLSDCVVMRKTSRVVAVSGATALVWRLIRSMDGTRSLKEILSALPAEDCEQSARLLAALAAAGVIDASGRAFGSFVHAVTKKGVLPGGGLQDDDVLRLATDGSYRIYADAPHIALSDHVPERLGPFHTLTRSRRSRRDYAGRSLSREDFAALLHTACGVTGTMPWEGRELKLRAYPSSGGLYAVEIYPVVFRVDELKAGVYHYAPNGNVLDMVGPGVDQDDFVAASLPVERQMVSGAAAMICLVGRFRRHERKYGEGGYRMLVAEAGHISQNLVLAATALGLSARPFGGVFDGLMNRELGLDEADEQFLLSVLVGHAGGVDGMGGQASEGKT